MLHIPFISRIALVWHFPLELQLASDSSHNQRSPEAAFLAMLTKARGAMDGQGEVWERKEQRSYTKAMLTHWKPCEGVDDLPDDVPVNDVKPGSIKSHAIHRELFPLSLLGNGEAGNGNIFHRQGHTWYCTQEGNTRHFRGILAGVTRNPSKAMRFLATGSVEGTTVIEPTPCEYLER